MTYHYTLTELSALGITDISLSYCSLAADTANLSCPMGGDLTAPLPWQEEDRIIICDDRAAACPRIFNGRVQRVVTSLSGGQWSVQVELANDVHVLERTTYAYIDSDDELHYAQSFYSPRAEGESIEGERLTSSRTVCERCFEWALAGGAMDCSLVVQFDATTLGIAGSGSQSCWSLMATALRWVPDAVTAMRYSNSGDALHILTARGLPTLTLDARSGDISNAEGELIACRCSGMTSCSLTPRPDLIPPVCALTGRKRLVLPEGGNVRSPGAFIYHVRDAESGISAERLDRSARQAAGQALLHMAPWQIVNGREAPVNISNATGDVNMRDRANMAPAKLLEWWQGFAAFSLLKEFGASALGWGNPLFEPVAKADAYPPSEAGGSTGSVPGATPLDPDADGNTAPSNYDDNPASWGTLYWLDSGAFPASAKDTRNLSGLKWCRGRLSQYVWIEPGAALPQGVRKEQVSEFFSGTYPVDSGGKRRMTHYALLSVEGIWINRNRVRYREGSNAEDDEEQPDDGVGDDTPDGGDGDGQKDPDYGIPLRAFYEATRKLYYDGSVTLCGVEGNPGELLGRAINITGLLPAWEGMQSPCNAVCYDPISRSATLQLGSREHLSVDEMLEHQELGRLQATCRSAGVADNPQDETPDSSAGNGDDDDDNSGGSTGEDEQVEMIAPSIHAWLATAAKGKPLNPFEVYPEGGKWYMNGGTLDTLEGPVSVEPTDITAHYAPNRRYYARPANTENGYVIRYTDIS